MNAVKIIATVTCLLLCLSSEGQRTADLPGYKIDSLNSEAYCSRAKQLTDSNNIDSLFEAYRIFKGLHFFDSAKYSKAFVGEYYCKIEAINLNIIQQNIIGEWNFEWSGSNWGTYETYESRIEKILINNNEIAFFRNDTLVRKTVYSITNEFTPFGKEFIFQIYFHDNKLANNISFRTGEADYNAGLKFNKKNMALYLNAPGICSDCGYDIYMKHTAANYRLRQ